jgi:hypothetical protein
MRTPQQTVERYTAHVTPGEQYALCSFEGGNTEMATFLNNMPPTWRLCSVQLVVGATASPIALFEISDEPWQAVSAPLQFGSQK